MREFNCLMIGYDKLSEIEAIQSMIDEKDLYLGNKEDEENDEYGIEKECHVTILYGIHQGIEWDDIKKYLSPLSDYKAIISSLTLFENDNFDVLKMDIKSPKMIETNKFLRENIEYTSIYSDYHPHMTIAYLKPGEGKKYTKVMLDKIIEPKAKMFLYSKATNNKYEKEKYFDKDLK